MITISPLFLLGIKVIGLTVIATILISSNVALGTTQQEGEPQEEPASDAPLAMIGQQYFADGTGIAYFNDGTTQEFEHTLTEDEGYYYDESTPFYLDAVPGVGNNTGSVVCGDLGAVEEARQAALTNSSRTMPSSPNENTTVRNGDVTDITIIRGASILEDKSRAVDPSPIVTIKVNDTVQWVNEDTTWYVLISPPSAGLSEIPSGTLFNSNVNENGGTFGCTFSEPGGYPYTLQAMPPTTTGPIKGAVVVTEEDTTSTSIEQDQQPTSPSPFSQQLQRQLEEE